MTWLSPRLLEVCRPHAIFYFFTQHLCSKSIDFRAIPGNTLGTVVDSGPLPGDGRTNFAVAGAGPGSFWNDFCQIADHLRDDRERVSGLHAVRALARQDSTHNFL